MTVQVINTTAELVGKVYADGYIYLSELGTDPVFLYKNGDSEQVYDLPAALSNYPNRSIVLKSPPPNKSSVLCMITETGQLRMMVDYLRHPLSFSKLRSRNKEQCMLLNGIINSSASCIVVEGRAGSGKTICSLAAALHLLQANDNPYQKVILSRPMSTVGSPMGAMPGDSAEKFLPYLGNFYDNLDYLFGKDRKKKFDLFLKSEKIQFKPLKLIGGSSWHNSIIIADEIQSLTPEQMYALITRVSENSMLILMGDSAQRYGKRMSIEETGLYQWADSELVAQSPHVFHIELIKQERSAIADLAYKVFVNAD